MPETTPLIKAALNLRVGVGFDVYIVIDFWWFLNPYYGFQVTYRHMLFLYLLLK